MHPRLPFTGSKSLLAVAIDVGTTYSGASYTFLVPGEVPRIYDVTGFKGQENRESNTKVPSVLFYSESGELIACGAETKRLGPRKGIRTEWFKLELRPQSLRIDTPQVNLPPGRTIIDVFGDFLKYMFDCVRDHIINTHVDGNRLWSSLKGTAQFVLRTPMLTVQSHPNGWGSLQQGQMREAAVKGHLVPNTAGGRERIEFVTEGEASFHWCIDQAIADSALKWTLEEEQMAPECAVAGSITVTDRFVKATQRKLRGTPYQDNDSMETLREEFDDETKCLFRENGDPEVYIRIGGRRDNFEDENGLCKIEFGLLEVPRKDIVDAFEPSVAATVDAIRKHIGGQRNAHVFLVGGFAASPWMLSETRRRLKASGINIEVKRADSNTAKAVAHGGVAFYLDRNIAERRMRHTYGVSLCPGYEPSNPEHRARTHLLSTDSISGITYVTGGFFTLVKKGELVKVDSVYRQNVQSSPYRRPEATSWNQHIQKYNGIRDKVTFTDMDPNAFEDIGWFRCDIPASAMTKRTGKNGAYYAVSFEIVITLGTVEIKAHVEWEENGVKKRTPANSMWEDYY
ncbi:hypothetical protein FRB90_008494 [Tulasnella sp. 427]|nr:hypothetical protein FRB90_008494 [Tulasnella sp. 427]